MKAGSIGEETFASASKASLCEKGAYILGTS